MHKDNTKKKYLKIINTFEEVEKSFGVLSPQISREYKIEKTIERLPFQCSRVTIYRALRNRGQLKKQEMFI